MTAWTERLDRIVAGEQQKPPVVELLRTPGLTRWAPGEVETTWSVDPDFFSIGGSLFGGYVAALADQVGCHAILTLLPDNEIPRTVSLSTDYLRPIRDGSVDIRARVVNFGRELINVAVEFRNGGDLAATARLIATRKAIPNQATPNR